jgi:hypothetical protein
MLFVIMLRHVTDQDFAHVIKMAVEAFNTWHFFWRVRDVPF